MTKESERVRLALLRMSDSRKALLDEFTGGSKPTARDLDDLSRFLHALSRTVEARRRTELRGLGVFEWLPWRGKLPTGRRVSSWRLSFKFNQRHVYAPRKGRPR